MPSFDHCLACFRGYRFSNLGVLCILWLPSGIRLKKAVWMFAEKCFFFLLMYSLSICCPCPLGGDLWGAGVHTVWCWLGQGICYLMGGVFCDCNSEWTIGNNPHFLSPQGKMAFRLMMEERLSCSPV